MAIMKRLTLLILLSIAFTGEALSWRKGFSLAAASLLACGPLIGSQLIFRHVRNQVLIKEIKQLLPYRTIGVAS
jgi:hypothetical protein